MELDPVSKLNTQAVVEIPIDPGEGPAPAEASPQTAPIADDAS